MSEQEAQPQVITLDSKNSVEILSQFVEVAQKAGAFLLAESDILKRGKDVLLRGVEDPEITQATARTLFMQAVVKGQAKGAYTLDDASIVHKVCQYLSQESTTTTSAPTLTQKTKEDDSLDSLSDPVPLRSGPRVL